MKTAKEYLDKTDQRDLRTALRCYIMDMYDTHRFCESLSWLLKDASQEDRERGFTPNTREHKALLAKLDRAVKLLTRLEDILVDSHPGRSGSVLK